MTRPIFQLDAKVVGQTKVADESFILSLEAPSIAEAITPGQFIQIRLWRDRASLGAAPPQMRFGEAYGGQSLYDPLLPRPFSIYRVRDKRILDILYEVVGRGTALLAEAEKGNRLSIFGPLGNTFSYPEGRGVSFLVGGGVGLAPFYDLAEALIDPKRGKQKKEDVIVLLGARNRKKVFCEKDFKELGVQFDITTDDGSYGFKGLVTKLLEKHLRRHDHSRPTTHNPRPHLYACGPKPMLRTVAHLAERFKIPCEVSIDAYMPCGYGICFGCAVRVKRSLDFARDGSRDGELVEPQATSDPSTSLGMVRGMVSSSNHKQQENGAMYRLACTDGPVFRAEELSWE